MLIGFDMINGMAFSNKQYKGKINDLAISNCIIDEIYIDEDLSIPFIKDKPDGWRFSTVLNAKLQNSLEGGSIQANNLLINKIRFQKRRTDQLEWEDLSEIDYNDGDKLYYEYLDKYIANNFEYQYSIIPVANGIVGNRVISLPVVADFEGVFLTDLESNHHMLYDLEFGEITNHNPTALFEPMNSRYPISVQSNMDYTSFNIKGVFLSDESLENCDQQINIRAEKLGKEKLLNFLKNGKPKVYKDHHGNLKVVTLMDNPVEDPSNQYGGLSSISFTLVEIGDCEYSTLKSLNLIK